MMSQANAIGALLEVAKLAIELDAAERNRKMAKASLGVAYAIWKEDAGVVRIEQGTDEWPRMMAATAPDYARLKDAKKAEHNAKRKLARAIAKHESAEGVN